MRIHICQFDRDCRQYSPPRRINIFTKKWYYLIAFWPGSKAQIWTKAEGYTDRWGWFARHPISGRD